MRLVIQTNMPKFKLNDFIHTIRSQQNIIKSQVIGKIQEESVYLLNNDLKRQDEFTNAEPKDLIIDFSNNLVYLPHLI